LLNSTSEQSGYTVPFTLYVLENTHNGIPIKNTI